MTTNENYTVIKWLDLLTSLAVGEYTSIVTLESVLQEIAAQAVEDLLLT